MYHYKKSGLFSIALTINIKLRTRMLSILCHLHRFVRRLLAESNFTICSPPFSLLLKLCFVSQNWQKHHCWPCFCLWVLFLCGFVEKEPKPRPTVANNGNVNVDVDNHMSCLFGFFAYEINQKCCCFALVGYIESGRIHVITGIEFPLKSSSLFCLVVGVVQVFRVIPWIGSPA